jgi:aquaporin Z
VFTVGLNVLQNNPLAPLSIGSVFMVLVFACGSVSGAHFNPAVTLGVFLSGRDKISVQDMFLYVMSQALGGLIGAFAYWGILGNTFMLQPQVGHGVWDAFVVEMLFTSCLVFVILNVATTEQDKGNHYFGLAIGFTLMTAAFACGGISGCCLNPALAFGATVANLMHYPDQSSFNNFMLYLITPLIGSVLASGFFRGIRPLEYRQHIGSASEKISFNKV